MPIPCYRLLWYNPITRPSHVARDSSDSYSESLRDRGSGDRMTVGAEVFRPWVPRSTSVRLVPGHFLRDKAAGDGVGPPSPSIRLLGLHCLLQDEIQVTFSSKLKKRVEDTKQCYKDKRCTLRHCCTNPRS